MTKLIETLKNPIAAYAFSADPITYGHINIVERIASSFPKCIVGIGRNPSKTYLFDINERLNLAKQALSHLQNVQVIAFDGMMVDFAYEYGANIIIKGVRSAADVEYEKTLHQVGASQKLGIDTHILFADPSLTHISSSVVKGIQKEHGFIHEYVPPAIKAALEKRISKQLIIGLTGEIAAGKSYLAEKLISEGNKRGITVHNLDLDALGHQILSGEGIALPLYQKIISNIKHSIGHEVIVNNLVDRKKLSNIVFSSSEKMNLLNKIMLQPLSTLVRRSLRNKTGLILLNGALLAEFNKLAWCNYRCIICQADRKVLNSRLKDRGLSTSEAIQRQSAQLNSEEKTSIITQEIKNLRFGKLWKYQSNKMSASDILNSVLRDCGEIE